jgi:hypothetical protein
MFGLEDRNRAPWKVYNLVLTSTPAGWATSRAIGVPYQLLDGSWRFKFDIYATLSSSANFTFAIQGISSSLAYQAITAELFRPTAGYMSGNVVTVSAATAYTEVSVSGDIPLSTKPTFVE